VLESQLGLVVNQPAGHDQVACHPLCTLGFEGFDLVLRGAVQFLARDVRVDFGRTFPVRPVGAAEVSDIGHAGRALLLAFPAETARAGAAAGFGTGVASVKAAGRAVLPVAEGFAVVAAETTAVTFPVPTRTITERLAVTLTVRFAITVTELGALTITLTTGTVTKRLTLTVTVRPALTVTVRPALPTGATTKTATVTLAITARTITKGLTITITELAALTITLTTGTVTKRLAVTLTVRFTVTVTELGALTITLTTGTIAKRLAVAITIRPALATGAATKTATVTLAITARTITKGLTVTITGLAALLSAAGSSAAGEVVAVAVRPGPEAAGLTAGVVVAAERAAVVAAVATVVLGHMDSSYCEPTTGATAAARFVSYATRNQALRSPYIFINSSGATKSPGTAGALATVSWPSSQLQETPAQILQLFSRRPLTSCSYSCDARSDPAGCPSTPGRILGVVRVSGLLGVVVLLNVGGPNLVVGAST
jgi:hypothetical protein